MAGHSHWAGIKHKKGKADKLRSNLFSKLSREITVAAKLGDKDPDMNSRLRSAIQAARSSNMPKDNIEKAIDKSSTSVNENFENLRYEGFGPDKIAVIVETLTDNKNRTASNIRTIFKSTEEALEPKVQHHIILIKQVLLKLTKKKYQMMRFLSLRLILELKNAFQTMIFMRYNVKKVKFIMLKKK